MHLKKAVVNSPVWNKRLGGKGRAASLARDLCQRHRGLFSLAQDLDFPKSLRLAAHNAALSARPVRSPGCLLIPVDFSEPFPLNAPSVNAAEAPL